MGDDVLSQPTQERTREARRAALKAIVAGGAAGAAFAAPKIEGFSTVPTYAAAATCFGGTRTVSEGSTSIYCAAKAGCDGASSNHNGTVTNIGNYNCWGNNANKCNCNNVGLAPLSIVLGGSTVTLNSTLAGRATLRGNCNNNGRGRITVTLSGLSGNRRCNVKITTANTAMATYGAAGLTLAFNTNGTLTGQVEADTGGDSNQTATVQLSCTCN